MKNVDEQTFAVHLTKLQLDALITFLEEGVNDESELEARGWSRELSDSLDQAYSALQNFDENDE